MTAPAAGQPGAPVTGSLLRFYVHAAHRHGGMLVWEWLLKHAADIGVRGASAFRAIAGFGRHHVLHEQPTYFDLRSSVTVEIDFFVSDREARALIELVHKARLRIFFAQMSTQFTVINPDREDVATLAQPAAAAPSPPPDPPIVRDVPHHPSPGDQDLGAATP